MDDQQFMSLPRRKPYDESKAGKDAAAFEWHERLWAWLVHLFTASGAVFGLLTFKAIYDGHFRLAFWLMAAAVIIDSVDGLLARRFQAKVRAPAIDGGLLDNILDYINYVMAPAFFLLVSNLLPRGWQVFGASVIVLASAYQFVQVDAKTRDHFFKGFPSYWNIVVFYIFFWHASPWVNLVVVIGLAILVFVPIKYVYPSRMDYLTRNPWLRAAMMLATLAWGLATAAMLWIYPGTNPLLVVVSGGYVVLYVLVSLYRTFVPLDPGRA